MPYYTTSQSPIYKQVSIDDLISGYVDPTRFGTVRNTVSGTRTIFLNEIRYEIVRRYNIPGMIRVLEEFTTKYAVLYEVPRNSLYHHFEIPKTSIDPSTGKYKTRPIDAPLDPLKKALYDLKDILENTCGASYHTNAFAYIPRRCAVDSIRRHQANKSFWFLKTDFSNFFGSITKEFMEHQLRMIFPFSEIYKNPHGKDVLSKAIDLCFLNNGLPQGTPISPMLTNLIMIPVDHRLTNTLRSFRGNHYIYTRYADDILVSSKIKYNYEEIVEYINSVLREFRAPFSINPDKTRFGSRNGHNFNLGVILNEKNEITIGYKRKMAFRGQLNDYIQRKLRGESQPIHDIQIMDGLLSYFSGIEPEYWSHVINRFNEKHHINLKQMIREDLH